MRLLLELQQAAYCSVVLYMVLYYQYERTFIPLRKPTPLWVYFLPEPDGAFIAVIFGCHAKVR
jgi:hypothetical protein